MPSEPTLDDFRALSDRVRNWGRWGEDDELGTLNLIGREQVARAASLVRRGRVFSLGVNLDTGGPQGSMPIRVNTQHFISIGGDYDRLKEHVDGLDLASPNFIRDFYETTITRINDDWIFMPTHAATQWDALSHVYYEGELYNGFPAASVTSFGARFLGIEKAARTGVVGRGVLVDVARHRGVPWLDYGDPIEPAELDEVLARQGVDVVTGDILVLRTGSWERFVAERTATSPCSGLSWRCAEWLHEREVAAVAADNLQVESDGTDIEGVTLALHCLCLRDMGMMLGEYWNLAELAGDCAEDGCYEFQLIAPPLRISGGIGSPLNPVAIK
jgi:kynurenine formamidase